MPDRILVIEDDEATRFVYERTLEAAGYQTATFGSFFEAAEEIYNGAGALLIVDLQLPPGTPQGLAVSRMARFHRPGMPIIFVTGHSDLAEFAEGGVGATMLKPVDLDVLVSTVRDLLVAWSTRRV
jgi:DNA-binding NtrC family response regulator